MDNLIIGAIFAISCIVIILYIIDSLRGKKVKEIPIDQETHSAMVFLLNRGVEIVFCSKHLYKNVKDEFSILFFDRHGNLKSSIPEETYDNAGDAVTRLLSLTGDKLERKTKS